MSTPLGSTAPDPRPRAREGSRSRGGCVRATGGGLLMLLACAYGPHRAEAAPTRPPVQSYAFDLGSARGLGPRSLLVTLPSDARYVGPIDGRRDGWSASWYYTPSPETQGYHAQYWVELFRVEAPSLEEYVTDYAKLLRERPLDGTGRVYIPPSPLRKGRPVASPDGGLRTLQFDYTWNYDGPRSKDLRATAMGFAVAGWVVLVTASNVESSEFGSLLFDGVSVLPKAGAEVRSEFTSTTRVGRDREFSLAFPPPPGFTLATPWTVGCSGQDAGGPTFVEDPWRRRPGRTLVVRTRKPLADLERELIGAIAEAGADAVELLPRRPVRRSAVGAYQVGSVTLATDGVGTLRTVAVHLMGDLAQIVTLDRTGLGAAGFAEADADAVENVVRGTTVHERTVRVR